MPHRSRSLRASCVLLAALFWLLCTPVHASAALSKVDAARAEATALEAKFKFKAGKFDEAAPLFLQAFTLSRKPALLYNAARAYEEAGKPAEARVAFEQYLTLPRLSAAGRKDAQAHIAKLQAAIERQKAEQTAAAAKSAADADAARQAARQRAADDKAAQDKAAKDKAARNNAARNNAAKRDAAATSRRAGTGLSTGRSKWLTYGIVGGAGLFLLVAVSGQLQALQNMADANAMNFEVENKFDAKQTAAKRRAYKTQADEAQQQQGSAVVSAMIGVALGGWAAYRLFTPDPAVAAAASSDGVPAPRWQLAPLWQANDRSTTKLLVLRGRF